MILEYWIMYCKRKKYFHETNFKNATVSKQNFIILDKKVKNPWKCYDFDAINWKCLKFWAESKYAQIFNPCKIPQVKMC